MLEYQKQQQRFASHIRDPASHQAPAGIEDRRLRIYRDLFFNNIEGFIASGFPVFKSLFDQQQWHELIRAFIASHKAETPYFLEISEEFLSWLDNENLPVHQQKPFACELCHYEWVELALQVADMPQMAVSADSDMLAGRPVVSPLTWPLLYQWPVHLTGPDYQPQTPPEQPTCLIVYRNQDQEIGFIESNPATLRLLELLDKENPPTGEAALRQLATEMQQPEDNVLAFGRELLEQLQDQGVILGCAAE